MQNIEHLGLKPTDYPHLDMKVLNRIAEMMFGTGDFMGARTELDEYQSIAPQDLTAEILQFRADLRNNYPDIME